MCQAIRDGGRRCPQHRHGSVGIIRGVASLHSELNSTQVDRLFSELRREGRDSNIPNAVFAVIRDNFIISNPSMSEETQAEVTRQLALSAAHDEDIDSATIYALSTLNSRATERQTALTEFYRKVSEESGLTEAEVKQKFEEEYASVDVSRGSETPVEYDQNTRRRAVLANLPYDRASVVAIERLRSLTISDAPPEAASEMIRRIERIEPSVPSRAIQEFGWHNGRLEIVFRSNPDTVYAYRNVSKLEWNALKESTSPGREWRYIRNNPAYAYDSQEEADQDALAMRCVNCGQFRSAAAHSCPQQISREAMLSSGMTTAEVNTELEELFPEEQTLADREERAAEAIIDLENQEGLAALLAILEEDESLELEEIDEDTTSNINEEEALVGLRLALLGEQPVNIPDTVTERRIELIDVTHESSDIKSFGWHDGRLEIILRDSDTIHAYHNVSEERWRRLSTSEAPIWRDEWDVIVANDTNKYSSEAEADADAFALKCVNCGQFRSADSHSCPEVTVEEEAVTETPAVATPTRTRRAAPRTRQAARITPEVIALEALPDLREDPLGKIEEVEETFIYEHESFITLASVASLTTPPENPDVLHKALIGSADDTTPLDVTVSQPENSLVKIETIYELRNYDFTGNESLKEEIISFMGAASAHNETRGGDYDPTGGTVLLEISPRDPESRNYRDMRKAVRIAGMYNSKNFHTQRSVQAQRQDTYESRYTTYRLSPITHRYKITERTSESVEENNISFTTNVDSIIESGDGVRIPAGATMRISNLNSARRFVRNPSSSIRSNLPGKAPLAAAYKDGKVVISPITVEYEGLSDIRDGIGFNVSGRDYASVSGEVMTRMTPEGEVQIVGQNLKCNCREYREKYNCGHIGLATQDVPKLYQAHSKPQPSSTPGVGDAGRQAIRAARSVTYSIGLDSETNRSFVKVSLPRRGTPFSNSINERRDGAEDRLNVPASDTEQMTTLMDRRIEDLSDDDREFIGRYHRTVQEEEARIARSTTISVNPLDNQNYLQALSDSDVEIPVMVSYPRNNYWGRRTVSGRVRFGAGSTAEEPIIISRTLKCDCQDYRNNYNCEHIEKTESRYLTTYLRTQEDLRTNGLSEPEETVANTLQPVSSNSVEENFQEVIRHEGQILRLVRYQRFTRREALTQIDEEERLEAERREQERQRIAAATAAYNGYRDSRIAAWETTGTSLAENIDTFRETVEDMRRRKRRGETVLEVKTENVTDGICAPGDGTRGFGIELEFDIKSGVDKTEALRKIGIELHEAGLTSTARQQGYHSANGSWETWSFEQDCTVAGEIVSPILKDSPEHWEQLKKVVEIVQRNGGRASTKAGSHVNISSGSLGGSTAKHAELTRIMKQNEEIMFRVASDPGRGSHRGSRWCTPNLDIANQDIDSSQIGRARSGTSGTHGSMVNYDASINQRNIDTARIEYRLWDATLDVAVIQQQVAFSAAMTDLAEREVIKNDGYQAVRANSAGTPPDADMKAATLFDRLFRTDEQRKAATQLFSITNPL